MVASHSADMNQTAIPRGKMVAMSLEPAVGEWRRGPLALLAYGRFDVLLSAALAILSVTLGAVRNTGWFAALDVLAAILAGSTVRWPLWAGLSLGLLLTGCAFLPDDVATMGEYAPLSRS